MPISIIVFRYSFQDPALSSTKQAVANGECLALRENLRPPHGNHARVVPADLAEADGPEKLFLKIERRGLQTTFWWPPQ